VVAAGDGTISLADYADTPTAGYRRKRREILRRYAPQDDGEKLAAPRNHGDHVTNRAGGIH
jgi:hypothetical protein